MFRHDVELWESKVLLTFTNISGPFSLTCLFLSMPAPVVLPLHFHLLLI